MFDLNTNTETEETGAPIPVISKDLFCGLLSVEEREKLEQLFEDGWRRVESADEHWIHGCNRDHDESTSYCYECAEKEIGRLGKEDPEGEWIVDGGWGTESDSTPFCESCHKLLSACLTKYGCESEIEHFMAYGFDAASDEDRRAMHEVVSVSGWEGKSIDEEHSAALHVLGRKILESIS